MIKLGSALTSLALTAVAVQLMAPREAGAAEMQATVAKQPVNWPYPSNPGNCACAFCTGKAALSDGAVLPH